MSREPILLTPGPLTTSERVKRAMLRDWGSRDAEFEAMTRFVIDEIAALANCGGSHVVVPLQGSGTFAVEAMLGTLAPRQGRILVLVNGAYGRRILEICRGLGIEAVDYSVPETELHDARELARRLEADASIATVAIVHCETTSGILNPLEELAGVAMRAGRKLLVDSMSGFGALPVDAQRLGITGLAASSNKCLQGVPGMSFVVCERGALLAARGRSASLVLDLEAQHRQIEADGQWRFTPPTHVIAALAAALDELAEEGGPAARLARYAKNCAALVSGMRALGFEPAIAPERQAPIIVSFREPQAGWFSFQDFYEGLKSRGFAIYAGKMVMEKTFRIGTIGAIDSAAISAFLAAADEVVAAMQQAVPALEETGPPG